MTHVKRFSGMHAIRAACFALLLGFPGVGVNAATAPTRAAHAKAAALSNVIAFTEWPKSAFATEDAPLVLGVVGQGSVTALLEQYLANEAWLGRRITLRHVGSSSEAHSCHVIFVTDLEHARWKVLAPAIAGRPILTVSDAAGFAQQGGIVEFVLDRDKVQLKVNLGVAREAGLTISSKVLRIAQIIGDRKP